MARIIYAGFDAGLMHTRKLLLERDGHTFFTAANERELVAACSQHSIEVAILSEELSPRIKRGLLSVIRSTIPPATILELYPLYAGKSLEGADGWLAVPVDRPADLLEKVGLLGIKASRHRAKTIRELAAKMKDQARKVRKKAAASIKKSASFEYRPPRTPK